MTKKASLANVSLLAVPVIAIAAILGLVATASAHNNDAFDNLTQEQQATLEEIRELKDEGNYEEARALAEEAGLPNKHGRRHERFAEVKETIQNNDYEAFLELTKDSPHGDEMTQEKFDGLVQIHELREAGDYEAAAELREELGLKQPRVVKHWRQHHNK